MDAKKILIDLVNIKTPTGSSNKEIIDYITNLFTEYETQYIDQIAGDIKLQNLIIKIPSEKRSKFPIIFVMHTDTVKGDWFINAQEMEDKIIGLGSCDMKAAIACTCEAVLSKKYERDIYLIFTADEESRAQGARLVKTNFKYSLSEKPTVIFTEPTSHKVITKQNSCITFKVTVDGIQKHASTSTYDDNLKENAVYKSITLCNYLIDFEKNNTDKLSSQNIVFLEGGTTPNIIANRCVFKFEQRYMPNIDYKPIIDMIRKELLHLGARNVEIIFEGEGFENTNKKRIGALQQIANNYITTSIGEFKAWTEAGILGYLGDCVVFGPGNIEDAHTEKESIQKREITQFTTIYKELLDKL